MKTAALLRNMLVVAQLIGAGLSLATPTPAAAAVAGNCATTATRFKWTTTFSSTTSTTYVNMPEMATTITQGSTGCVIVQFSAAAAANANQQMVVRVQLGSNFCGPLDQPFIKAPAGTGAGSSSHAMTFVCQAVGPDVYTVRVQYLSVSGGQVIVTNRTMLVHYMD
jgi:hypothetical protein